MQQVRGRSVTPAQQMLTAACFAAAVALSVVVWIASMRSGVAALDALSD